MYPYASLATIAAAVLLNVLAYQVGRARFIYGAPLPGSDGPPEFQRRYRAHMNMVEQAAVGLPAIWMCAIWVGDLWGGLGGAVWVLGRILYARGYYVDSKNRMPGFFISLAASAAMGLAAAVAILAHLI
jgi:uncharacterized membrane protein YecN with MAPEG domain